MSCAVVAFPHFLHYHFIGLCRNDGSRTEVILENTARDLLCVSTGEVFSKRLLNI